MAARLAAAVLWLPESVMTTSHSPPPDLPPSAPRLSILHVMVSTAITAVVVALIQAGFAAGYVDAFGGAMPPLYAFVVGLTAGPAIGMLLVVAPWRWRGFRFPSHGGEWMALIAATLVVYQLVMQFALGKFDDVWRPMVIATEIEIGSTAVKSSCFLLGAILVRPIHWRIAFLLLLVPSLMWLITFTLNYLTEGFPIKGYDGWLVDLAFAASSFRGVFLVIPVLFALIIDLVRYRDLPWTHWLGVGLYLWLRGWGFIYPSWLFDISTEW